MSQAIDVSPKLGEYMLKGWILTDRICPTGNCNVPLMRSPQSMSPTVHYCAGCDTDPFARALSPTPAVSATPTSPAASSSVLSRPSTPPTEVSSGLSSPTFAPPIDTPESIRRRQLLDEASAELGRRMLQGYAMLADECPNPRCFGVPLVRPPKTGPEKDPRKECVMCERIYINQNDMEQFQQLEGRKEPLLGTVAPGMEIPASSVSTVHGISKGKVRASGAPPAISPAQQSQIKVASRSAAEIVQSSPDSLPQSDTTQSFSTVSLASLSGSSISALELALDALRQRLNSETASISRMDIAAVGTIAGAMDRTAQAILSMKTLHGRGA